MTIVDHPAAASAPRLAERRITLELADEAKRHIVKVGYDPHYGARPLKRTIQKELETPLGRKILAGDINDGDTVEGRLRRRARRADVLRRRSPRVSLLKRRLGRVILRRSAGGAKSEGAAADKP